MLSLLNINNLKTYLIVIGVAVAVWFFKDYKHQVEENKRQTENISQIRYYDSLKYASQTYTKKELDEYLEYNRQDLRDFLEENKIRTKRIERIITQSLKYKDTSLYKQDLKAILDAINEQKEIKVPVIDSTDCMIIKGFIQYDGKTLDLNITERQFKNKSDVVTYWERNQWKFLGIKTRLFGKKKATVTIKDNCGNTETFVIDKN